MECSVKTDLPINLERPIKRIIEKEVMIDYKIDVRRKSSQGCNFAGELYEIDVSGKTKDGDSKKLFLFAKHATNNCVHINLFSLKDWYQTELFAYEEVFKIFENLQEEANVPLNERYQVPKFYEQSNLEVIIMENLTKRGFTSYPRTKVAPLNFFEIVVGQLAKFHGLSLVLREKRSESFTDKIKSLNYPYHFGETWRQVVEDFKNLSINYVDEKYKGKLVRLYENIVHKFEQYNTDESIKECLCHGDYRFGNSMFKMENDKLQEIVNVDFQTVHYGCPVFDFFYLIFLGTDRKFREAHLSNLKEHYFETLGTFLKYFDLDIEVVYSREKFEKVYREKLDFGLMCCLIFLPIILSDENTMPDFSQSPYNFRCDDILKDRLHEVIEEFTEWGFIE